MPVLKTGIGENWPKEITPAIAVEDIIQVDNGIKAHVKPISHQVEPVRGDMKIILPQPGKFKQIGTLLQSGALRWKIRY